MYCFGFPGIKASHDRKEFLQILLPSPSRIPVWRHEPELTIPKKTR
jgi:hypothetical protein